MFQHGEGWNESKEWVFAMETAAQGVFAVYKAEDAGFGSGTICLPYIPQGEEQLGVCVGV